MARTPGTQGAKKAAEIADKRAKSELFGGVTVTDLSYLFHMDRRTIMGKISEVSPCGFNSRGGELYQIDKVAPFLIPPISNPAQIDEAITRMNPRDLPPILLKEYWNGKRARQRYEEDEGDLWRTDRVIQVVGSAFKTVRMNLLLIPDVLERRNALTDRQREEVRAIIDETLSTMRDELVNEFSNDDGQDDRHAHDTFVRSEDDYADVFDDETGDDEEL